MRRNTINVAVGILAALGLLVACAGGQAQDRAKGVEGDPVGDAKRFLATYNDDCARLEGALNRAFWKAANSGDEADFAAYADASLALKAYHSDPQAWATLQLHQEVRDQLDPVSARSLDLAVLAYRGNQLRKELL